MTHTPWQRDLLAEGELYLVGGTIRDELLGRLKRDPDRDYLVRGIPPDRLERILRRHGKVHLVGKSFGVYKFRPAGSAREIDLAYPRKETSTGPGHRDFRIEYDWSLPIEEDLGRRDFTINAIARNLADGDLIDPCGGRRDIERRVVRMIFREAFGEDPLRILRGVRFVARFDLTIDPVTEAAMKESIDLLRTLSAERIQEELNKILAECPAPSAALEHLRLLGGLAVILPELDRAHGVEQNEFHPDDVYWHSLKSCDAAPAGKPLVRWAALLHDLGKVDRKQIVQEPGQGPRVVFYGHEEVGARIARRVLSRMRFGQRFVEECAALVAHHMFHYEPEWTRATVRRFIRRVGVDRLEALFELREADCRSRGLVDEVSRLDELRRRIRLEIDENHAFKLTDLAIDGNDVIETLGISQGEQVGQILRRLFDRVVEAPELNDRQRLLAILRREYGNENRG